MEGTVTIAISEFEELLKCKAQKEILISITQASKYSVDREEIATIFGFDLVKHEDKR